MNADNSSSSTTGGAGGAYITSRSGDGGGLVGGRGGGDYAYFSLNVQRAVHAELPKGTNVDDIAREIERRWSSLSADERGQWSRRHASSIKNIGAAVEVGDGGNSSSSSSSSSRNSGGGGTKRARSFDEEQQIKSKTSTSMNKNKKIRRPLRAYEYFLKDVRPIIQAQLPNAEGNTITQRLSQIWSQIGENEKQKYRLLEKEGRAAFREAKEEEWKQRKNAASSSS